MARQLYHSYHEADTTQLLNEKLRGIVPSGVYWGFICGIGSSVTNLYIVFTHEADPDNTGSVLGKLQMPDAITVEENANQDNVALWTNNVAGGNPRMDAIVATYTYNASLPANDVTYSIVNGTVAAAPVLPTLTDDQILLGWVYAPAGAADLTTCTITTAGKASLAAAPSTHDILEDILRSGRVGHMECVEGSAANKVTIKAGDFLTKEAVKVEETADQADYFNPITDTTTATKYRYDLVILAHKYEDTSPQPDPHYFIVEGIEQNIGTKALLSTRAAILTAAAVVDPKYTSWTHINILAVLRVQGQAGSMDIEYMLADLIPSREQLWVADGRRDGSGRSTELVGLDGLEKALDLAWGRLYRSHTGVTDAVGGNTFTDASASFLVDNVQPGDYLYILDASSSGDNGKYTVSAVTETTLTTTPVWPVGSLTALTYEVVKASAMGALTGYLISTDGAFAVQADGDATGGAGIFNSGGSNFLTYGVEQGDLLYIFNTVQTDDNGVWRIKQVTDANNLVIDTTFPNIGGGYIGLSFCIIRNRTPKESVGVVNVDGIFHTGHTLHVPSRTSLEGAGEYSRIVGDIEEVVDLGGFQAEAAAEDVCDVQIDADQTGVPAGHWRWQAHIRVAYQTGSTLYQRRFSRGDIVEFHRVDAATKYGRIIGSFEEYDGTVNTDDWAFKCIVPKVYKDNPGVATAAADFNGKSVQIRKRFTGAEDIAFGDSGSRAHIAATRFNEVAIRSATNVTVKNVSAEGFRLAAIRDCCFADIEIGNGNFETEAYTAATADNLYWFQGFGNNVYRNIVASRCGAFIIGRGEEYSTYDGVHLRTIRNRDVVAATPNVDRSRSQMDNATAEEVLVYGEMNFFKDVTLDNRYGRINIYSNYSTFENILCGARNYSGTEEYGEVQVYGNGNMLGHIRGNLTFTAAITNNWAKRVAGTITDSSAVYSNRVLEEQVDNIDWDRNFYMSSGSITWDAATNQLSWIGDIDTHCPFTAGLNRIQIASSPITLTAGQCSYISLSRDAAVTTNKTTTEVAPVSTPDGVDILVWVRRVGTSVYFADGTLLSDGASGELGTAVPGDGSVTWVKLADSAKGYVNELGQDFVLPPSSKDYGFTNDEVYYNSGLEAFVYTAATGVLAYGGIPAGFAAAGIVVGDIFLDSAGNRYRIVSVANVAAGELTLDAGLPAMGVGGVTTWQGSIVRGNFCWRPAVALPTYAEATGVITVNDGESLVSVSVGYVFVDSSGNEFKITAIDDTAPGKSVTIAPYQDVSLVGVIADSCYVRTDNNPRELLLPKLHTRWGAERVDLFNIAVDDNYLRAHDGVNPSLLEGRVFVEADDPRVAFSPNWAIDTSISTPRTGMGVAFGGLGTASQDNRWISYTGIFTDLIIIVHAYGTRLNDVYLDGESLSTLDQQIEQTAMWGSVGTIFCEGEAGYGINRKTYCGCGGGVDYRLRHLPYGVHTVTFDLDPSSPPPIKSLVPIVSVPDGGSNIVEDAGQAYVDMGILSVPTTDQAVIIPSVNAFGGRVVRYIDDTTRVRTWATKNMPVNTTTGNTTQNNTLITGVGSTNIVEVGDMIRVILSTGDDAIIRQVAAFPAPGQITLDAATPNVGAWTDTGATLQRYCQTWESQICGMQHGDEEIAQIIPVSALVPNAGVNPGADYSDTPSGPTYYQTPFAAWLQNGEFTFDPKGIEGTYPGRFAETTEFGVNSYEYSVHFTEDERKWYFYFVGTGIDIFYDEDADTETADITIEIDGNVIGDFDFVAVDATHIRENVLGRLVQNLPMGGHIVKFESPLANSDNVATIRSFVVYQPSTPNYSGMRLAAANVLPDHDTNIFDALTNTDDLFEQNMIFYPKCFSWLIDSP